MVLRKFANYRKSYRYENNNTLVDEYVIIKNYIFDMDFSQNTMTERNKFWEAVGFNGTNIEFNNFDEMVNFLREEFGLDGNSLDDFGYKLIDITTIWNYTDYGIEVSKEEDSDCKTLKWTLTDNLKNKHEEFEGWHQLMEYLKLNYNVSEE